MATILCVADDPATARLLDDTIVAMEHTVVRAACVHEALGVARERAVDLVVAEFGLSDLTGIELLRILRDRGRDVPLILVTEHDAVDNTVQAFEYGAEDCISKPVRLARIEAAVRHALERATLRRQNEALMSEVAALRAVATTTHAAGAAGAPVRALTPEAVVLPNLDIVEAERILISTALERSAGNKTRAAGLLNMSLRTLRHKLNAAQVLAGAS